MAETLVDARYQYLIGAGYSGHINDMLLAWLQDSGATSDNLNDAWSEVLTLLGYPGHRNDAWFEFLGAQGHTGSINEREFQFWNVGAVLQPR